MRMFSRSLALAVASAGLIGFVGCGEDNEKAGGEAITKPAGAPTAEEYSKAMSKGATTTEDGKSVSPTIPGSTAPPPAASP